MKIFVQSLRSNEKLQSERFYQLEGTGKCNPFYFSLWSIPRMSDQTTGSLCTTSPLER